MKAVAGFPCKRVFAAAKVQLLLASAPPLLTETAFSPAAVPCVEVSCRGTSSRSALHAGVGCTLSILPYKYSRASHGRIRGVCSNAVLRLKSQLVDDALISTIQSMVW
jgi:hypothetical protein